MGRVRKKQRATQLVDQMDQGDADLHEPSPHAPEATVARDPRRHLILLSRGDVYLTHLAPVRGGQVLRRVLLAPGAMTARVAAPAGANPEAPPDEGAFFAEDPFDLFAVFLRGLGQALPEAAGSLGHGGRIRLCWHTDQYITVPETRSLPGSGNSGGLRGPSPPTPQ